MQLREAIEEGLRRCKVHEDDIQWMAYKILKAIEETRIKARECEKEKAVTRQS